MKSHKFSSYLTLFLVTISLLPSTHAIETSIETKISVETSLENRLRKVLTEITGTDKIIIIINTELYSEKDKKEFNLQSPEKKTVLPGVPVKESIAERKIEDLLAPLDLGDTKTMIKRINATVIMDKGIPDSVIAVAKKVTTGLLGIDTTRGDTLSFEKMSFHTNIFNWKSLLFPPMMFYVIAIILATLFVFSALLLLFNPFKIFSKSLIDVFGGLVAAQKERSQTETISHGTSIAGSMPDAASASIGAGGAHSAEEKRPFWFARPEHEKNIHHYLMTEQNADNAAVVINYLPKDMASRIFSTMPSSMQTNIALRLSESKELSQEFVKLLEQKVKNKLDFSLGGEDILVNLLNYSDKAAKNEILTNLKSKNNELAARIEEALFGFEDIILFDADTIQSIIRHLNLPVFSQILKTMTDDFKGKILSALPEAAKKRIQQEMDLGKSLPKKRIDLEKRKVIDTILHLQHEGLIKTKHN